MITCISTFITQNETVKCTARNFSQSGRAFSFNTYVRFKSLSQIYDLLLIVCHIFTSIVIDLTINARYTVIVKISLFYWLNIHTWKYIFSFTTRLTSDST